MVLNVCVLKLFLKGLFVLFQMSWKIVSFQSLCVICFLGFLMGSCCATQLVSVEMKVYLTLFAFWGFYWVLLCNPIGFCRNGRVF